jgi:uncharacterized protein YdeI (YjbR/CyaY-like superfamily)
LQLWIGSLLLKQICRDARTFASKLRSLTRTAGCHAESIRFERISFALAWSLVNPDFRRFDYDPMAPKFFATQEEFRKWLEKNSSKETELLVGFHKVNSGKPSMTWSESVDQALCFGWIDGVRKSIDKDTYQIRFTPRKPSSIWSAVNIQKVKVLMEKGLMKPSGIACFEKRKENRSKIYSYENEEVKFPPELEKQFKANKTAWKYFQSLAPSYKKTSKNWVMSAKREETKLKRLNELIKDSQSKTNRWKENKYNKKTTTNIL